MSESLKMIIALFHEISSTLGVCREDLLVMIEQHQRDTLLVDRIQESTRRLNGVIESMPHMTDLLNAISEEPEAELPEVEEPAVEEPEADEETAAEPAGDADLDEFKDSGLRGSEFEAPTSAPEPPPEDEVG